MARYRRVAPKARPVETPAADPAPVLTDRSSKDELVAAAKARGLDTSGTKADILERLR